MACRQEKRTITDFNEQPHEYFVIQKPASEGEKLKFKLIAMLGPSIGKLKGLQLSKDNQDAAIEAFGESLSALFEKNDPDAVFAFLQNLVLGISRDGERITAINFDEIYTDNIIEFYKACALVLEVNFANFFKGLKFDGLLAKARAAVMPTPL